MYLTYDYVAYFLIAPTEDLRETRPRYLADIGKLRVGETLRVDEPF